MKKKYSVNSEIRCKNINLVLTDGSMKSNIKLDEALDIANQEGLDVVEVSSKEGEPPICKVMDYGKFMYHIGKKEKGQHKHVHHNKEIKYGLNISSHDLEVKHKKILEFMEKRYDVRYILELKGREKNMVEKAVIKINENLKYFTEVATWSNPIVSSGKRTEISTILKPV